MIYARFYDFDKITGKRRLIKEQKLYSGLRFQFHGGYMEEWCKEIIFVDK